MQSLFGDEQLGEVHAIRRKLISEDWLSPRSLFIIFCSDRKAASANRACDLYTSTRFKNQIKFVELVGARHLVFSGQLGLVDSAEEISPYECDLTGLDEKEVSRLVSLVCEQLKRTQSEQQFDKIAIFSPSYSDKATEYVRLVAKIARFESDLEIYILPTHFNSDLSERNRSLRNRIGYINNIFSKSGQFSGLEGPEDFSDFLNLSFPNAGVYYFLDADENSLLVNDKKRIVRIGTHGVATGSKATLQQRLRAHYGLVSGGGNHRSSIFRLHVGECLLKSGQFGENCDSWGNSAPTSQYEIDLEAELELSVSSYIRNLQIMWLAVAGPSHKNSRRSQIERKSIQALTLDQIALDKPTNNWLGHFSSREAIVKSGIWNVQHVGEKSNIIKDARVKQLSFL